MTDSYNGVLGDPLRGGTGPGYFRCLHCSHDLVACTDAALWQMARRPEVLKSPLKQR
ncbi:hypothetical protein PISMIDRAFT_669971 [Pisolithus microcarpus 441]|uniref:Uncharacterized protein n=1 Tax=Pisolithus microcarpus 441 TaxID=765257 RepID=A0A0C9Z0Q2_9AGAM|nr:hypothetical protein PISMIDRAFT_669971 [Pisolithus microcarpus 441]